MELAGFEFSPADLSKEKNFGRRVARENFRISYQDSGGCLALETTAIKIRRPNINDGARIWELVKECKPLDLNSSYLYLMLCFHFSDTCLVAENGAGLVGFVSAYIPPRKNDIIFVWQIAVHESVRGQGLGKMLLHQLIQLNTCKDVRYITCTVSPSNETSKNLFSSFAKDLKVEFKKNVLFTKNFFPKTENHEDEVLFQIGPLR